MTEPRLVATAWTSAGAGDTSPMRTPATSPVPVAERIAAAADAGFTGLGLIADDLRAVRASHGFPGLRDGAIELPGLVTVLHQLAFDGPWGVEILSASCRKLPVGEALKRAAESAWRCSHLREPRPPRHC